MQGSVEISKIIAKLVMERSQCNMELWSTGNEYDFAMRPRADPQWQLWIVWRPDGGGFYGWIQDQEKSQERELKYRKDITIGPPLVGKLIVILFVADVPTNSDAKMWRKIFCESDIEAGGGVMDWTSDELVVEEDGDPGLRGRGVHGRPHELALILLILENAQQSPERMIGHQPHHIQSSSQHDRRDTKAANSQNRLDLDSANVGKKIGYLFRIRTAAIILRLASFTLSFIYLIPQKMAHDLKSPLPIPSLNICIFS